MEIEIDVLRAWIDGRLSDLVASKAVKLQERQREFVDGSIDTLLGLRSQFCKNASTSTPGGKDDKSRPKARSGRNRSVDASETTQVAC